MVEPLELESRIWSDRGTRYPDGDEVYRGGRQPIAEFDNHFNWAISTDLHNLRDQVGGLDDVYYRQSVADGLFYARHEADDRFLDADGDTAADGSVYDLPDADLLNVTQVRQLLDDGTKSTGVRLQDADISGDVIILSDGTLPGPSYGVFSYENDPPLEERRVIVGNPDVPRVQLRGDELDLNGVNISNSEGAVRIDDTPVRFYAENADGVSQRVAEITPDGDLNISGTVNSNQTF